MARPLINILQELEVRQGELLKQMESLRQRVWELEEENEELRRKEAAAYQERDKALTDVEYLIVSHKLADSPDSLADTRRVIAGLIRNIDRCIAMLKE